ISHDGSVAVGRFHHSLGDGMSLMSLLLSQRKAMRRTLVGHYISYLILAHIHGYRMLPGDNATPHKGKLSATVGINKFIHRIISLDDVKMVKSAMNMGLTIHIQSYLKKVIINLAVDVNSMTSAVLEMGSHKLEV
ncbi:hypothetical protein HID58_076475, partial [Brassica napus]